MLPNLTDMQKIQDTKPMAAYFAAQNRNKASVTVNYTLPEGQDLISCFAVPPALLDVAGCMLRLSRRSSGAS